MPSNFQRKTRMRERFGFFDTSVNGTFVIFTYFHNTNIILQHLCFSKFQAYKSAYMHVMHMPITIYSWSFTPPLADGAKAVASPLPRQMGSNPIISNVLLNGLLNVLLNGCAPSAKNDDFFFSLSRRSIWKWETPTNLCFGTLYQCNCKKKKKKKKNCNFHPFLYLKHPSLNLIFRFYTKYKGESL